MKVANFITNIFTSVLLFTGICFPFSMSLISSLISLMAYNSPRLNREFSSASFLGLGLGLAGLVFALLILIFGIVDFARRRNFGTKKYTGFQISIMIMNILGCGIIALMTSGMISMMDQSDFGFIYVFIVMLVFLLILNLIFTIVNAAKSRVSAS